MAGGHASPQPLFIRYRELKLAFCLDTEGCVYLTRRRLWSLKYKGRRELCFLCTKEQLVGTNKALFEEQFVFVFFRFRFGICGVDLAPR